MALSMGPRMTVVIPVSTSTVSAGRLEQTFDRQEGLLTNDSGFRIRVSVTGGPIQSPGLNLDSNSLQTPTNLMQFDRTSCIRLVGWLVGSSGQEEWNKRPKSRCEKLAETYRIPGVVITVKEASRQYCVCTFVF